ncbi:thiamine-phosphate kinase [candidate division KSB1 bacterium]|nr:thiamine-phosphate kinase [candidate division KSB1 bacterium]
MRIRDIGGEFKLIERVTRAVKNKNVIVGIGDDAAVFEFGNNNMVVTMDTLCEEDHFSRRYFTPKQIGIKAMESNLSDIAAMGGRPLYALLSFALPQDVDVETMDGIYDGLYERSNRYGVDIIGGDTTHSSAMVISVTLIGQVDKEKITTRSGARPGDIIRVTGPLGASTAGLKLFVDNRPGFAAVKLKHTEPSCRLDVSEAIAGTATAMEDVSDGLASEVRNICQSSGTGAMIYRDKIPVEPETIEAAKSLGEDGVNYALFGGEDFELVYTVPPVSADRCPGVTVGEIFSGSGVYLEDKGERTRLSRFGWDHFNA